MPIFDFRLSFLPIFLQSDYKSRAIFLVEELGQFGSQYHHPELLGHVNTLLGQVNKCSPWHHNVPVQAWLGGQIQLGS